MVDRAMAALQGGLARRQRLLHTAGNQPDLRAYTARRAGGPRLEPLPYLLIVVDEFSELLAAGPSSWTSSPPSAGSVAAWACISCSPPSASTKAACAASTATSVRICLRTFSAAESTAVLGVPDATALPPAPAA